MSFIVVKNKLNTAPNSERKRKTKKKKYDDSRNYDLLFFLLPDLI